MENHYAEKTFKTHVDGAVLLAQNFIQLIDCYDKIINNPREPRYPKSS